MLTTVSALQFDDVIVRSFFPPKQAVHSTEPFKRVHTDDRDHAGKKRSKAEVRDKLPPSTSFFVNPRNTDGGTLDTPI